MGLGKTIEAGLVISQRWAERRRHILVITPSNLRKQWFQELTEKFFLNHAMKNPGFVYGIDSHRRSHNVSYQTARTDLLPLAEHGLLERLPGAPRWPRRRDILPGSRPEAERSLMSKRLELTWIGKEHRPKLEPRILLETKAANEMDDPEVLAKARAAATWCRHASDFAATHVGKPWTYVLIPHDEVTAAATLAALVTRWSAAAP